MTHRAVMGGTVVSVALLLAACSGGSSGAKDAAPTKAEATAAAKAINLTKADVAADFTSTPADDTDTEGGAIPEDVADCLGLKGSAARGEDDLVDLSSDSFSRGAPPNGVQVSSEVEVVPSTKDAQKVLTIFKSDKATGCLAKSFENQFTKQQTTPGVTIGKVKVTTLTPSAAGTDGAFGFRLAIPVKGPGITIDVTTEIRGFIKKHTEVTLLSLTYGSGSGLDSDALFATLVSRAGKSAV